MGHINQLHFDLSSFNVPIRTSVDIQVCPCRQINICVGEHIYACVYMYIHIYMCIYICVCVYIQIEIYIHIHTYIYVYSDTYVQMHHVHDVCVRRMLCKTLLISLQSTRCIYCFGYSDMVSLFTLLPYISAQISYASRLYL